MSIWNVRKPYAQIGENIISHARLPVLRRAAADLEGFAHSAAAEAIGAVRKVDAARVHVYGPKSERKYKVAYIFQRQWETRAIF